MSQPLGYGRQITLSRDNEVVKVHEKLFTNFETTKNVCLYTQTVRVRSQSAALAEFLVLQDRAKVEDIHNIGMVVIEDKDGSVCRVELTWQVYDLL